MAVLLKEKKAPIKTPAIKIAKSTEPIRKQINFEKEADKELYYDFLVGAYNVHNQDFAKRVRTLIKNDVETNKEAIHKFKTKKNVKSK